MLERTNRLGAGVAITAYVSAIGVFVFRLAGQPQVGHWFGSIELVMALPLVYLLVKAPQLERPPLYYLQIGLMLVWLAVELLLDYIFLVDFRHTSWMVISYVMLFFAGTGGMLGVAAHAGRRWMLVAVALFLIMAVLTFVQRAVTGM